MVVNVNHLYITLGPQIREGSPLGTCPFKIKHLIVHDYCFYEWARESLRKKCSPGSFANTW